MAPSRLIEIMEEAGVDMNRTSIFDLERILAAMRKAVELEREECAQLAEDAGEGTSWTTAAILRGLSDDMRARGDE